MAGSTTSMNVSKPLFYTFTVLFFVLFILAVYGFVKAPKIIEKQTFQCADGTWANSVTECAARSCPKCPELDCLKCPVKIEAKTVTVTKYQCSDGSVKDSLSDCEAKKAVTSTTSSAEIYSTNFMDYGKIFHCGPTEYEYTDLQKEEYLKDWIGKWVVWTGKVYEVSESSDGKLVLKVKHCDDTWTYDIHVSMKDDQRQKLLSYNKDDTIKYKGKILRRVGNTYLDNGELV